MSATYLVCLPHKFDILSLGITPEELRNAGISLGDLFAAMEQFRQIGKLEGVNGVFLYLLNKLVKYIFYEFDSIEDQLILITDAAKCKLATLLIQEGLCEETQPSSQIAEDFSLPGYNN